MCGGWNLGGGEGGGREDKQEGFEILSFCLATATRNRVVRGLLVLRGFPSVKGGFSRQIWVEGRIVGRKHWNKPQKGRALKKQRRDV